ncbi:hypothetical protein [Streptomyces sp. KL116D]|uniref:hypothetical protein n=1 Tax=Streptomyces sp. KL116D TaxID=3045152 RepID=UPI003555C8EC
MGDLIEASALGAVSVTAARTGPSCGVGSVKTNVGHFEGAAGIVGLLKAALCIRHRELVPSSGTSKPPTLTSSSTR